LYVFPDVRINPLLRVRRAHKPSLSAVVSLVTVSGSVTCARKSAGDASEISASSATCDAAIVFM